LAQGKKTLHLPKHPCPNDTTSNNESGNKTPINVHDDDEASNKPQCKWVSTSPTAAASGISRGQAND